METDYTKQFDAIWGSPTPVPKPNQEAINARIKELDTLARNAVQKSTTVSEKILDFTGGKLLGKGFGEALAQKGTAKGIEETQKQQFDIQTNLLQHIKEKRAKGENTDRLQKALKLLSEDIESTGLSAENYLNPSQLTGKQVVGDALQLATTAGAGKLAGTIAKSATGSTGFLKGTLQGAKTGALTGAGLGGATGFAEGLQEDKTIGESIKKGLGHAALGGVTGGVLGAVTGGISGGIKGAKANKANRHLDAITPKAGNIPTKEYEELVTQGRIRPKTATSPAQYILSDDEINTANKYKNLLTAKDPVKNTANVINEVRRQDQEVGNFLRKNNAIFNNGELRNHILQKLDDISDIAIPEERLSKAKQTMVNNFINSLEKNDMETLWKARKAFDSKIEKAFSGSPTLQKEVKKALRNAVQDFIGEKTPEGVYKGYMKDMSNLLNLKDTLITKASSERKLGSIAKWAKENEQAIKIVGGLGVLGGAYATAKSVLAGK